MRTLIIVMTLVTTALLIPTNCNKSSDPAGTDGTPKDTMLSIGKWHYAFPPIPFVTTDTLNIWLDINTDSSYSLELIERKDKTLFSSTGTWVATDDSLFLTGDECTILDTSATPDTLATIDDTTCAKPFALAQPANSSAWTIKTTSVAAILMAFPIPPELVSTIPVYFPEIPLKKVVE